jgi:hypothetical protein
VDSPLDSFGRADRTGARGCWLSSAVVLPFARLPIQAFLASGAGPVSPAEQKGRRTRTARLYDAPSLLEGGISSVGHNGAHVSKHSSAE